MEKERKERALVLLLLGFCLFGAARKLLGAQKTVIQKTNLKKNIIKRRKTSKGIKTTKTKRKNPRTETELYIRHAKGRRKKNTKKKGTTAKTSFILCTEQNNKWPTRAPACVLSLSLSRSYLLVICFAVYPNRVQANMVNIWDEEHGIQASQSVVATCGTFKW